MYYGKLKNSDDYGFGVFENRFEHFVEIDDDLHWNIIQSANNENKMIVPDDKGYPILVDRPKPTEKEIAETKVPELTYYLSSTDWYVLRFIEEGIEIPAEIKQKRHDARLEISRLQKLINS